MAYPRAVHRTAAKVQARLRERGLDVDVQELPDSTRTAPEAAAAVGVDVGQIVKSLVFTNDAGEPFLVLCAGDLDPVVGFSVGQAERDLQVRRLTRRRLGRRRVGLRWRRGRLGAWEHEPGRRGGCRARRARGA